MIATKRIEAVDSLRGFAIISIFLIHSSNHFLYDIQPIYPTQFSWLYEIDQILRNILYFLFEGKAYGIFAVLFGFTFGIQYNKVKKQTDTYQLFFLWRWMILASFGLMNAAFFSGGDPLIFMSIVALVLPFIAHLRSKSLIAISIVLFLQPIELFKGLTQCFNSEITFSNNIAALYKQLEVTTTNGDFLAMVQSNITTGIKACLSWAIEYGRASQTLGLYIVGLLLYRNNKFSDITTRFWKRLFIINLIITPTLYFISNITIGIEAMMITLKMWYNLSFTFMWISSFILLYRTFFFNRQSQALQIYGRMSLTNFIFQSIIGTFIFYPYGLNLSTRIGTTGSVVIATLIALSQIIFSYQWLKRHKYGPFEFIWHRMTYMFFK
ncbi:DUF418 domain-containing protein [Halosquirtibacter xylanolyticus]|uniref:DUF418 domain-containing protein n=1 Tax=Halosquirtibacter xylanolyticus TaxID=3374599 RepID=UPI0037478AA3|nr:DUF418 domain-containing protein [Prolixibacteraceae bacterium]